MKRLPLIDHKSVACGFLAVCCPFEDHIHCPLTDPHEHKHNASICYEFAHIFAGGIARARMHTYTLQH